MKWRVVAMIVAVLLLLVACVASCLWFDPAFNIQERVAIAEIESAGGYVDQEFNGVSTSLAELEFHWNRMAPRNWRINLHDPALCRHVTAADLSRFHLETGSDRRIIITDKVFHLDRLRHLHSLDATGTDLNDDLALQISRLPNLRYLFLSDTDISDMGVQHLSKIEILRELALDGTRITDSSLWQITEMKHLEVLFLGNTQMTGAYFSELNKFQKLKVLSLDRTEVDDTALRVLATHPSLEHINVERTKVTLSCVEELCAERPTLRIRF